MTMRDDARTNVTITVVFAVVAIAAIVAPLRLGYSPVRFVSVFAAIILGPGTLAYRLATGRRWGESLAVGIPLSVGVAMVLGLVLVYAHEWHPVAFELLIPLTTLLMSGLLLPREMRSSPGTARQADSGGPEARANHVATRR
jgi:hypothetical protein